MASVYTYLNLEKQNHKNFEMKMNTTGKHQKPKVIVTVPPPAQSIPLADDSDVEEVKQDPAALKTRPPITCDSLEPEVITEAIIQRTNVRSVSSMVGIMLVANVYASEAKYTKYFLDGWRYFINDENRIECVRAKRLYSNSLTDAWIDSFEPEKVPTCFVIVKPFLSAKLMKTNDYKKYHKDGAMRMEIKDTFWQQAYKDDFENGAIRPNGFNASGFFAKYFKENIDGDESGVKKEKKKRKK